MSTSGLVTCPPGSASTVAATPRPDAGPTPFDRAKSLLRPDVALGAAPYLRSRSTRRKRALTMPKRALITGASRGLGLALARALVADGWELIIDARGERDLHKAAAEL